MALYADLHRHLGGALHPKIVFEFLTETEHDLLKRFSDYNAFHSWYTGPHSTLADFVSIHTQMEELQSLENLPHFCRHLSRGAWRFEDIRHMEIRYNPYFRTDTSLSTTKRLDQMHVVVDTVAANCKPEQYPISVKQILCLDRRFEFERNLAIVKLAIACKGDVAAVDMAGPEVNLDRHKEWVTLFKIAREGGLATTGHIAETTIENFDPAYLDVLMRFGHAIKLVLEMPWILDELAKRRITLEICPTNYIHTGTLKDLRVLKKVFGLLKSAGVPFVVGTDNPGRHPKYTLLSEFERLVEEGVIDMADVPGLHAQAFASAFGMMDRQ